jgi:hypothetical protein
VVNVTSTRTATANYVTGGGGNPTITLGFDGILRDKVGQGESPVSGDGQLDGTFTMTLGAASGNRIVTGMTLTRSGQVGVWDTIPGNGFWALGAATSLDTGLLNAANGSVNIPLSAGGSLKLFAADFVNGSFPSGLFTAGSTFTVNVNFLDGSSASANVTVPGGTAGSNAAVSLSFEGMIRDRVGQGESALAGDGQLDGTFTITLSPSSGNQTITGVTLTRSGPVGVWDTTPGDQFWVIGAAIGLDSALLNAVNGTVSFPLTAGASFKVFAADFVNGNFPIGLFTPGATFSVQVNFSDGSSANANVTL